MSAQVWIIIDRNKRGRIAYVLDWSDAMMARECAYGREAHPRTDKAKPVGNEGIRTHLQGAMAEIAVCRLLGAEFNPVYGGRDPGYDLTTRRGKTIQVKSTPHFHPGVKLFAMPHEMRNAEYQVLCCVDTERDYVEIVGYATTEKLWDQPLGRVARELPECRWLVEEDLTRIPEQVAVQAGSHGHGESLRYWRSG